MSENSHFVLFEGIVCIPWSGKDIVLVRTKQVVVSSLFKKDNVPNQKDIVLVRTQHVVVLAE